MRVAAIRTHELDLPMHTTFVTALRSTSTVHSVLVEVIAEDGTRGFGEAPEVWRVTGESVAGTTACIEGPLAGQVVGRDLRDTVRLLRDVRRAVVGNTSAKAAVDVAVHDLLARADGVPLVERLGGSLRLVDTDVTLAAGTLDRLVAAALARVADGFTVLKVKVGTDPRDDVRTVTAIRDAVGPDVMIRLDANQGWTERDASTVIVALEDAGTDIEFVEQPVAAPDLDAMARITRRVQTPVMADESVFGVRDLLEVIRRHAADLVNVKLAKCGGLAVASTMLELAAEAGIGTIVGSMMESPVGVAAAASLAAAHGTSATGDLDAAWWLANQCSVGVRYDGSSVVLSDQPGLGIENVADLRGTAETTGSPPQAAVERTRSC